MAEVLDDVGVDVDSADVIYYNSNAETMVLRENVLQ